MDSGLCERTLLGHTASVTAVAALRKTKCVSASNDNTLKVWNIASGYCERTLEGHVDSVLAVIALGEMKCVSASVDNTWKVWDVGSGVCETTIHGIVLDTPIAALRERQVVLCAVDHACTFAIVRAFTLARAEHIAPASFGSADEASSGCGDMSINSLDDVASKLSSDCDESAAPLRNALQTLQKGVQAEMSNICYTQLLH